MAVFNNKEILWIFSHPQPVTIPSYICSINTADYMGIKKIIFLQNHNAIELVKKYKPKYIIISKVFNSNIAPLIFAAKQESIKVISIFDDWSFPDKFREKINLPIAKNSDIIVAKTRAAADEITKNTGIECKVIPDPIRFKTHKVFKSIQNPLNVCWFGMNINHDSIIGELENLDNLNLKIKLTIITNFIPILEKKINNFKLKNIIIDLLDWTDKSYKNIINSEVVILPYPRDKIRLVKSSNRIIDSINLGRFTIISDVEQFKEFEKFTYYGEIPEGILWLKNNLKQAIKKTKHAQEYVLQNYSLKAISEKWLNIIK